MNTLPIPRPNSRRLRGFSFRRALVWPNVARYGPLLTVFVIIAASALCALVVDARVSAIGAAAGSVAFIGVLWPWLSLRCLRGQLSFGAARAAEGDLVLAQLQLHNALPATVYGMVLHGLAPENEPATLLQPVAGRRDIVLDWEIATRRGLYPLSEPTLSSGFPFGLWEARRLVVTQSTLLVRPRTFVTGPIPSVAGHRQHEGAVASGAVGGGGDIVGVRPFRDGDSLRRVHWAQTARCDRLIVCETQGTQLPMLEVAIDLDTRFQGGRGQDSTREWAIRIAASLCAGWCNDGAVLTLYVDKTVLGPASGARHRDAMLDALGSVPPLDTPGAAGSKLADICRATVPRQKAGLRVIVTTLGALAALQEDVEAGNAAWSAAAPVAFIGLDEGQWNGTDTPPFQLNLAGAVLLQISDTADIAGTLRRGFEEVFRAF